MARVIAKVISQKGTCASGHKAGDEFVIDELKTPEGMCPWAFVAVWPFAQPLLYGASFPWKKDPSKAVVACPDPDNPVVFELGRER